MVGRKTSCTRINGASSRKLNLIDAKKCRDKPSFVSLTCMVETVNCSPSMKTLERRSCYNQSMIERHELLNKYHNTPNVWKIDARRGENSIAQSHQQNTQNYKKPIHLNLMSRIIYALQSGDSQSNCTRPKAPVAHVRTKYPRRGQGCCRQKHRGKSSGGANY